MENSTSEQFIQFVWGIDSVHFLSPMNITLFEEKQKHLNASRKSSFI